MALLWSPLGADAIGLRPLPRSPGGAMSGGVLGCQGPERCSHAFRDRNPRPWLTVLFPQKLTSPQDLRSGDRQTKPLSARQMLHGARTAD